MVCIVLTLLILVALLMRTAEPYLGIDVTSTISDDDLATIKETVTTGSFAIVRVFNYDGTFDSSSLKTLLNLTDIGIEDISAYWIPCVEGSNNQISKSITCRTPKEQLAMVIESLNSTNIQFRNTTIQGSFSPTATPTAPTSQPSGQPSRQPSGQPTLSPIIGLGSLSTKAPSRVPTKSPTSQPSSQPSSHPSSQPTTRPSPHPSKVPTTKPTLSPTIIPPVSAYPTHKPSVQPTIASNITSGSNIKVTLKRLYINVEDDKPNKYFTLNVTKNLNYLLELSQAAYGYGIPLGIYTTPFDWFDIIENGQPESYVNPFSEMPLWTPRYDGLRDMTFFGPFSGWNHVFIKQLSGGSTELRRGASTRICLNYIDESSSLYSNFSTIIVPPIAASV